MDSLTPVQQQLQDRLCEAIEDMTSFRAGIAIARREIAAFMKEHFGVSRPDPTNMVNARLRLMFEHPQPETVRLLEQIAFVQWTVSVRALLTDKEALAAATAAQPEAAPLIEALQTRAAFRRVQDRAFEALLSIDRHLPAPVQERTARITAQLPFGNTLE